MEQQPARSWSHLPDLCLLLIFKKLPMNDMFLSIGRVCINWKRVQREEMLNRKTLIISTVQERDNDTELILEELSKYENPYGSNLIQHVRREDGSPWARIQSLKQLDFDTLRVPNYTLFTEEFTTLVMDTLPNITHLTLMRYVIFHSDVTELQQLTSMIRHYSDKLVSLKLDFENCLPNSNFFKYSTYLDEANFSHFHPRSRNLINRLDSPPHLRLNITKLDSYPELSIQFLVSHLTYDDTYAISPLLARIAQYVNRDDLRVECDTKIRLDELIQLDPKLADKFTRVNHFDFNSPQSLYDLRLFCHQFVSLHTLGLATYQVPMTKLAEQLSQLSELIHLKLRFDYIPEEEVPPPAIVFQITSVRLLNLTIYTRSHHDTERLHLHQVFPNLQVLGLLHETDRCKECHFDLTDFKYLDIHSQQPEVRTRIVHCMRLARQTFRQCANLHTVKLDSDDEVERRLLPQGLITRDQL